MPIDDPCRDPETEPRVCRVLGGEERLIDASPGLRRHSISGVGNGDAQPFYPVSPIRAWPHS